MHLQKLILLTLGIKWHRVLSISGDMSGLTVTLARVKRRLFPCSKCKEKAPFHDCLAERRWRHVPIWGIPVQLVYRPCRVRCKRCGIHVEKIPWSMGKSTLSLPLIHALAYWGRELAIKKVAELFHVHWNTVYRSIEAAVKDGLASRDLSNIRFLGIDEISRCKGHVYHTQVYDLLTKRLLWSGQGRDVETLNRFFKEFGLDNLKQVEAVCCDMWKPYEHAIRDKLPHAALVFDKYHVTKYLLDAVDEIRRKESAKRDKEEVVALKGMRYLLLKNTSTLQTREINHLDSLAQLNENVHKAWLLKEQFQLLWRCSTAQEANQFLDNWVQIADESGLKPMKCLAKRFRNRRQGILDYFNYPITNGPVEAMNNNAKAISHRARGFKTEKTFVTLLYHCLGGLSLPTFHHRFW